MRKTSNPGGNGMVLRTIAAGLSSQIAVVGQIMSPRLADDI